MHLRPFAAYALAAALALGVAGCTATPPDAEEPATSQSESAETTETTDTTEATDTTDAGGDVADTSIEGWPAEVPVPAGEVQQNSSTGGLVSAAFQVTDVAAADAYTAELEAAGFTATEEGPTEIAGVVASLFEGNGHLVAVSAVDAGSTVILSVAIQPL